MKFGYSAPKGSSIAFGADDAPVFEEETLLKNLNFLLFNDVLKKVVPELQLAYQEFKGT